MPLHDRDWIFVGPRTGPLADLFVAFQRLSRFYEASTGDRYFWWTERTLVGALAASATATRLLRWPAAEEYQDQKRGERGRTDLYLQPPRSRRGWAFEFKRVETYTLRTPASTIDGVQRVLGKWKQAVGDADRLTRRGPHRYGAVWAGLFFAPASQGFDRRRGDSAGTATRADEFRVRAPDDWHAWARTSAATIRRWTAKSDGGKADFIAFYASTLSGKPGPEKGSGEKHGDLSVERFWPGIFLVLRRLR